MRTNIGILIFSLCLCCCLSCGGGNVPTNPTKTLAFPGADGGGKYTTGGRGGSVVHVTNLTDDGSQPGSLRYALNLSGKRIIVFDISGTIQLSGPLNITNGGVTIAGQTAPGDGICIAGYNTRIKCSNVVIRFMRFRMGDENGQEADALSCDGNRENIIIDHCSFSWSTDECVSCYGNSHFTLQYCFITESLNNSVHAKGAHGYGGIWGGTDATFHHNLIAHHSSRLPRFDHSFVDNKHFGPIDYVNNVVYNWKDNNTYGGEGVSQARQINFVNNYYKYGPATSSSKRTRLLDPTTSCENCSPLGTVIPGKFYLSGNYMYGSTTVTNDNWQGSTVKTSAVKATTRWTEGLTKLDNEQTAEQAYETVLSKAGCSLHRDTIDSRIVNEVRSGTYTYSGSNGSSKGLIDTPADVKGRITYQSTAAPTDTDRDGMPDSWETANGLNPNEAQDNKLYTLDKEYTNIEVYINSLVKDCF